MRRLRLLAALPVVLLAAGLSTPGGAAAAAVPTLQPYLVQEPAVAGYPAATVLLASPDSAQLGLRLKDVPADVGSPCSPTRFSVQLPTLVWGDTVPPEECGSEGSDPVEPALPLTVPGGTPCGDYPTLAQQTDGKGTVWSARGVLRVQGCPTEFDAMPLDQVRTGEPTTYTFRGRYLPPALPGTRTRTYAVVVDGSQVGDDVVVHGFPTAPFRRSADLDLACGRHPAQLVDRTDGTTVAARTLAVRCPALVLDPDTVARTALPLDAAAVVSGLLPDAPYALALDGAPVARGGTDAEGADRHAVPLPDRLACGVHVVAVDQDLPDPTGLEPFPEVVPADPPGPPPGPLDLRPDSPVRLAPVPPSPGAGPPVRVLATSPPTDGPTEGGGTVARHVHVVAPLTVSCPGAPTLDVTPELVVDAGQPVEYRAAGSGFGDDAQVTLTAGGQPAGSQPVTADGLGRFAAAATLRLPCGATTFSAVDAAGHRAVDTVQVRCPALVLHPAVVAQSALPGAVDAAGSGFASGAAVDVLLDGSDVGDATASVDGAVPATVPLGAGLSCGTHRVELRQRGAVPAPTAGADLTVVCPPAHSPLLTVGPDVLPGGRTAVVTGTDLPPGPLHLVWQLPGGAQRPALGTAVQASGGGLRLTVLLLRGELLGPRRLLALPSTGPLVAATDSTLVVPGVVEPGRRPGGAGVGPFARR